MPAEFNGRAVDIYRINYTTALLNWFRTRLFPIQLATASSPACRSPAATLPVWSDEGKPVRGEKGGLVCTKPFPSMPVMFWNDPEGRKYHAAYFERFSNVWCHGD